MTTPWPSGVLASWCAVVLAKDYCFDWSYLFCFFCTLFLERGEGKTLWQNTVGGQGVKAAMGQINGGPHNGPPDILFLPGKRFETCVGFLAFSRPSLSIFPFLTLLDLPPFTSFTPSIWQPASPAPLYEGPAQRLVLSTPEMPLFGAAHVFLAAPRGIQGDAASSVVITPLITHITLAPKRRKKSRS